MNREYCLRKISEKIADHVPETKLQEAAGILLDGAELALQNLIHYHGRNHMEEDVIRLALVLWTWNRTDL